MAPRYSQPLQQSPSMEKRDRTHRQGNDKGTIAGVHGRSRHINVRQQRASRRPGHSTRHPTHQQGGWPWQHQSDGRTARRTGDHTKESPGGARTKQSKEQSAAKRQIASTWPGQPAISQQAANPGCSGGRTTQRKNILVQGIDGNRKRSSRPRRVTSIRRHKRRAKGIQQARRRANKADETVAPRHGEASRRGTRKEKKPQTISEKRLARSRLPH